MNSKIQSEEPCNLSYLNLSEGVRFRLHSQIHYQYIYNRDKPYQALTDNTMYLYMI